MRPRPNRLRDVGLVSIGLLAAVAGFLVFLWMPHFRGFLEVLHPPPSQPNGPGATTEALDQAAHLQNASATLELATVVLSFLGFLVALVAIFGWASIRERVDTEVARAMRDERMFDHALGRFMHGAVLGSIAQYLTRIEPGARTPGRPDEPPPETGSFFLKTAIPLLEQAVPGLEDQKPRASALNALAYCLALRADPGDGRRAYDAIETALDLSGHRMPEFAFLLTKGTVLAAFSEELTSVPTSEIQTVYDTIDNAEATHPTEVDGPRKIEIRLVKKGLDEILRQREEQSPERRLKELVRMWWGEKKAKSRRR